MTRLGYRADFRLTENTSIEPIDRIPVHRNKLKAAENALRFEIADIEALAFNETAGLKLHDHSLDLVAPVAGFALKASIAHSGFICPVINEREQDGVHPLGVQR